MGKSNNTIMIGVRIPNELMKLKHEYETPTEFVMRAILLLRDQKTGKLQAPSDPDKALLTKLIPLFIKNKIKASLTKEEIERIKELYKP